jgi:hypothetical protein
MEKYITERDKVIGILRASGDGNIKVLGTTIYDLRSTEISLSCDEAADQIMNKGINITF